MVGAVREDQTDGPPSIAERRELGGAPAWVKLDRNLSDIQALFGGANDHLESEFHAWSAQLEGGQNIAPKRSHTTPRIADGCAEDPIYEPSHYGVSDVSVHPGHCSRIDQLAVSHNKLCAALQLGQKTWYFAEVIGQIGIGHDDVLPSRCRETRQVSVPVASAGFMYDRRPGRSGKFAAVVNRAVVNDNNFAGDPVLLQNADRGLNAPYDVLAFVQARDDHGERRLIWHRRDNQLGVCRHPLKTTAGIWRHCRGAGQVCTGSGLVLLAAEKIRERWKVAENAVPSAFLEDVGNGDRRKREEATMPTIRSELRVEDDKPEIWANLGDILDWLQTLPEHTQHQIAGSGYGDPSVLGVARRSPMP
jgi:hypothetical protein